MYRSRILFSSIARNFSQGESGPVKSSSPGAAIKTGAINTEVPGLTEKCLAKPKGPVGPGVEPSKSGDYKVPEYFCYNDMTYYEAEIEMSKYRQPQPSSLAN